MKNVLFLMFCFLLFPVFYATAFDLSKGSTSFETEIIADDYGYSISQYGFLFQDRWSALIRGFIVEPDIGRHAEFEIGPTFRFTLFGSDFEILNTFGFTTDGSFTTGHTVLTTIAGKPITLIVDPKWYLWNRKIPSELLQRLVVGNLVTVWGSEIALRSEYLTIYDDDVYWRIGPQISLFSKTLARVFGEGKSAFTIMPHYDARQNTFGTMITMTINP